MIKGQSRLGAAMCLLLVLTAACSGSSSRGTARTPSHEASLSPPAAESPAPFEIAFTSKRNGSWSIFTVDEEGRQEKVLDITTVKKGPTRSWLDLLGQTDWSPDGESFVFTCTSPGRSEICLSQPGGFPILLTSDKGDADVHPTWAPDGERVFYADYEPDPLDYEIYSIRPDGSDEQLVLGGPGKQADPAVSPDGRTLAVTTFMRKGSTVSLAALNEHGVAEVFKTMEDASTVDWSPDGTQLVFSRSRDKRFRDLYLADARGRDPPSLDKESGYRLLAYLVARRDDDRI